MKNVLSKNAKDIKKRPDGNFSKNIKNVPVDFVYEIQKSTDYKHEKKSCLKIEYFCFMLYFVSSVKVLSLSVQHNSILFLFCNYHLLCLHVLANNFVIIWKSLHKMANCNLFFL
jgi:hypothetical protein